MDIQLKSNYDYNYLEIDCYSALAGLATILKKHKTWKDKDPLSQELWNWTWKIVSNPNYQHAQPEHLYEISQKIHELTTHILIEPLFYSRLKDPVLDRSWVWERENLEHYKKNLQKYYTSTQDNTSSNDLSPFDDKKMEEEEHSFAKAIITWIDSLPKISLPKTHQVDLQLSHPSFESLRSNFMRDNENSNWPEFVVLTYRKMASDAQELRIAREEIETMEEVCKENKEVEINLCNKQEKNWLKFNELLERQEIIIEEKISTLKNNLEERIEEEKKDKQRQVEAITHDNNQLKKQAEIIGEDLKNAYFLADEQTREMEKQEREMTQQIQEISGLLDKINLIKSSNQSLSATAGQLTQEVGLLKSTLQSLATTLHSEQERVRNLNAQCHQSQQLHQQDAQIARQNRQALLSTQNEIRQLNRKVAHLQDQCDDDSSCSLY